jgi:hypothetical protein
VEYELTKRGGGLWEAVEPLGLWARTHVNEILKARQQFDQKNLSTGRLASSASFPSRSARVAVNPYRPAQRSAK